MILTAMKSKKRQERRESSLAVCISGTTAGLLNQCVPDDLNQGCGLANRGNALDRRFSPGVTQGLHDRPSPNSSDHAALEEAAERQEARHADAQQGHRGRFGYCAGFDADLDAGYLRVGIVRGRLLVD